MLHMLKKYMRSGFTLKYITKLRAWLKKCSIYINKITNGTGLILNVPMIYGPHIKDDVLQKF